MNQLVFPAAIVAMMLMSSCATQRVSTESAAKPGPAVIVPASDPQIRYEGRFDFRDKAAPVIVWQASRVFLNFAGDRLALRFGDLKGQVFFDATIDGQASIVELREGKPTVGAQWTGLGAGRHELVMFKRSEAAAGSVAFRGVELAPGGTLTAVPPPNYPMAMMFIGDSITVGACNEDGAQDQWEDRRTHNGARSYAAFTAAHFHADHRNIAMSGMGICMGYVTPRAIEVWDRLYPDPAAPKADLSLWRPDVVFINLGENDDSFSNVQKQPFPADYTERYITLVHAVRAAYPKAEIVILRGGMFGGSKSERLRGPWDAVVAKVEQTDPRIRHFAFTHWTSGHPRVADDRAMADELIQWLEKQPFMQGR